MNFRARFATSGKRCRKRLYSKGKLFFSKEFFRRGTPESAEEISPDRQFSKNKQHKDKEKIMKIEKSKRIVGAFACVLFLIGGSVNFAAAQQINSNDKLTAEIEKAVHAMYDAFVGRDETGFKNVIADGGFLYDEYGYITATDFKKETAGYFKSTPKPNTKLSFEITNLKVVAVADDTAIASYEIAQRTEDNGKTRITRDRHTDVLVRRAGRWQIFAEHGSKMPKLIEPVSAGMPNGWRITPEDSKAANYRLTVDNSTKHGGAASARISGMCADNEGDWASLAQSIQADEFRGRRVRLTGWLKTDGVNKAGLWMRVDGNRHTLGFDNMDDRAVTGTSDWKQYSVVLDVPAEAVNIYFGTLVQGAGNVWADDFKLETVGSDVAATNRDSVEDAKRDNGREAKPDANKKAVNLDFEAGAVAKTN